MCFDCIYVLKVVSHYGLNVLSMSVIGFHEKKFGYLLGGWGELYQLFVLIF